MEIKVRIMIFLLVLQHTIFTTICFLLWHLIEHLDPEIVACDVRPNILVLVM